MSSAWRPFVPDQAVQAIREHPDRIPVAAATRHDAVVLFADIAGFTPMSESLAKLGRYGSEELSRVLNDYFSSMVERAVAYGGTVARLAGDAMTVLFPRDRATPADSARRALGCALDMQAAMAGFQAVETRAGTFRLAMRVGLAAGAVLGAVVGDPEVRLEYVVAGRPVDRAAEAERRADVGQVAADGGLLDPAEVDAVDLDDGTFLVNRLLARVAPVPAPPPDQVEAAATARLAAFLHPAIAERLRTGRRGLVNEHREVTVAFVGFPNLADDDPEAVASLQAYLAAAVRTIDHFGGHLSQVDTGDKGSLLMLTFGAPVAHEDDQERAVGCCLELLRLPGGPFHAGVTTGSVFCGEIGSERRRHYTVVGDSVNLAARLLQAAEPGQLLIDAATFERVAPSAVGERLRPITVKGRSGPVTAWAVRATRERPGLRLLEPVTVGTLVGRDAEIRTIDALAGRARSGSGQVLCLTGEAGIGKSRLVAEAVAASERLGFVVHGGACRSYGTATGYLVWRSVLGSLLGVDPDQPLEQQRATVLRRMAAHGPGWAERAPLLAPVLGLPIPDSGLTRSLDPPARIELLRWLVVDLVRREAAARPLLLVFEDCHWIDQPSMVLLELVAHDLADRPVFLVVAARTEVTGPSPTAPLARLGHGAELELDDLPAPAAEELAAERLHASYGEQVELPAEVISGIADRAGGNPFHIEELVAFLHARGIDPGDPRRLAAAEIPDSLQRLVLARLDQLDHGEQAIVKVAAVIGRVFRARWLWGSYPAVGSPDEVARHLEHLDALGLTPLRSAVPEAEYGFKHAIIQEVAYDSLAFGMRQTLHEAVGGFIERTYADRLDEYVDVLAHHYGNTQNQGKQRVWFRAAADAAKAGYANEAAVEQYERLLPLLGPEQTGDVLLQLGGVWHLVGRWADAERAYRRAIEVATATGDRALLAASTRDLGILTMRTRSYAEGVTLLDQAAAELEELGELRGLAVALDRLAFAAVQQGAYTDAAEAADRHLAIATQAGDPREVSGALHNLGLVAWDTGRRDQALELLRRALEAAAEAGDRRDQGRIASDLAAVHAEGGAHRPMIEYLGQALSIARQIGDRWVVALCIGNLAELYLLRGEYAEAARYSAQALSAALELGDWGPIVVGVGQSAAIAAGRGETERAEQLFTRAEALARAFGDTFTLHAYLPQHAKLLADQGRWEEAELLNREILEPAADTDSPMRLRAELLSLRLQVALGRLPAADAVQRLAAMGAAATDTAEQAAISETIWRIDPEQESARQDAATRYHALYEHAPTVEYRDAYAALTGVELPPGEPLPSPLESAEDAAVDLDLDALLARVDQAAEELAQPATA